MARAALLTMASGRETLTFPRFAIPAALARPALAVSPRIVPAAMFRRS